MKELKIEVPKGYEIDKENSTFECIKFKLKGIKTWHDLCVASLKSDEVRVKGYRIGEHYSDIYETNRLIGDYSRNVFLTEKEAKSALAMAQISQLIPYYGGAITQEEWNNVDIPKFSIIRDKDEIDFYLNHNFYMFLSFHTSEQRDRFLENNEQLIKDYLMLD